MSLQSPPEATTQDRQRRGYRFGDFQLYPSLRLLFRGDDKVEIGQIAFSFILFMVENAGRPLSKDEITTGVWHRTVVGEATFRDNVTVFRDLFGRDALITLKTRGYQCALSVERLSDLPPELTSAKSGAPQDNLPPRTGTGFGRQAELDEARQSLARERALTVLGPGGIGKTWLAIELGRQLIPDYPGGVHLIALAAVRDATGIGSALAKAVGVALHGTKASLDAITAALRTRPKLLLIFDSCDYAAQPAGVIVAALLERAPNVSVLATSQEVLHIPGERVLRLEPLPLDDAIDLFCDRVHAADHRFQPGANNRAGLTAICRRLDGMPHALELAAARVPGLGIDAVAERLGRNERFRMLSTGSQTLAARQQTLLATVEWSYGLLDAPDQRIFRRLSCFAGSFSREAAIAVAGTDRLDEWEIIDALQRLVNKSLLTFTDGGQPRYRLLETLRLFGAAKLTADGEDDLVASRRMDYLWNLFDAADDAWETLPDTEWVKRYGLEVDNVRGVLDWALERPERTQSGIALCGAAGRLWHMLNLAPEGRRHCDRFVELIDDETPLADAARLLKRAAMLWRLTDRQRAVATMARAAALYRQIDDRANLGAVLGLIGGDCAYLGRYNEAKDVLDEAQNLLVHSNRPKSLFAINIELGLLAKIRNDAVGARSYQTIARDFARKANDALRENIAIFNLAEAEFLDGSLDRAVERAIEAISGLRAAGLELYVAQPLTNLAAYLLLQGNVPAARSYAEEALPMLIEQAGHWLRLGLQGWAQIAALEGRYSEAAQLCGFVEAEYGRTGEIREQTEQALANAITEILASVLTQHDIEIWTLEGTGWSESQAIDFLQRRVVHPNS